MVGVDWRGMVESLETREKEDKATVFLSKAIYNSSPSP
jgi:hypothetical protein